MCARQQTVLPMTDLTRADLRRETITLRVPEPFCKVGLHRVVVDSGGAAGRELATQPAIN